MPLAPIRMGDKESGLPADQIGQSGKVVVRYKGPFDFTYIYRNLKRWFEQRRFRFYEGRIKDTGKRLKVDLWAQRDVDEIFSERYDIKIESWHLTPEEVIVNGEPRKILNGLIQFTIKDQLIIDRPGWFTNGNWFTKWMGQMYLDIRWREIENEFLDIFQYRAQDILTYIKELLNMTTKRNAPW